MKGLVKLWENYGRLLQVLIPFLALSFFLGMWNILPVSIVIPMAAVIVAHWTRKVLHPYINTERLLKKVEEDGSVGAALVVFGIILFNIVLISVFCIKLF